jgi:hypothetical protein
VAKKINQGNGPVDSAADAPAGAPAGGEGALLHVRGNQLKQGVWCRSIRKYGIISRQRDRWDRTGEREVQHDESEDVERRTKLYTQRCGMVGGGGWQMPIRGRSVPLNHIWTG